MIALASQFAKPNRKQRRDIDRAVRKAENHIRQARAFVKAGKLDAAKALYFKHLAKYPDAPVAWHDLGILFQKEKEWVKAGDCYEKAMFSQHADDEIRAAAMNNFGEMMVEMKRDDKAAICFAQAAKWNPKDPAIASNNSQYLILDHKFDEADKEIIRAISLNAESHEAKLNRGGLALLLGNFEQGWTDYEHRFWMKDYVTKPFPTDKPKWNGEDLTGKTILLTGEQGFGDVIMFIRYAKMVKSIGAKVLFHGHEALRKLFSGVEGIDEFILPDAKPEIDFHCPLMSLPQIFGTGYRTPIPAEVPYIGSFLTTGLSVPAFNPIARKKIGIAWGGSPKHAKDHLRTIAPELFQPLTDRFPECDWFSFQVGPRAEEFPRLKNVTDLSNDLAADFTQTAMTLRWTDLLISVDTSIVHLAGALARPVWMLTPYSPDWRWMLERADSPWYPTLRLFRQKARGDWESVMAEVGEALFRL